MEGAPLANGHQKRSAVRKNVACCAAWIESFSIASVNSQGACHTQSPRAEINHAETGAEMNRQAKRKGRVRPRSAMNCRQDGDNAYKKGTTGRLSTSKGAETSIRISCWVMWTQKSCSPISWMGESRASRSEIQPRAKYATERQRILSRALVRYILTMPAA